MRSGAEQCEIEWSGNVRSDVKRSRTEKFHNPLHIHYLLSLLFLILS